MYSPRLPTALELGSCRTQFSFPSVVDSGADYCIFPLEFGERLGIDFKNLQSSPASGFGGGGHCFYHKINVLVVVENLGLKFECFAGFSDQMDKLGIGLLGRHGFFELFEEVIFDQRNRVFKLKVPGERPINSSQTPANSPAASSS